MSSGNGSARNEALKALLVGVMAMDDKGLAEAIKAGGVNISLSKKGSHQACSDEDCPITSIYDAADNHGMKISDDAAIMASTQLLSAQEIDKSLLIIASEISGVKDEVARLVDVLSDIAKSLQPQIYDGPDGQADDDDDDGDE